jgi:hypothetical protein
VGVEATAVSVPTIAPTVIHRLTARQKPDAFGTPAHSLFRNMSNPPVQRQKAVPLKRAFLSVVNDGDGD